VAKDNFRTKKKLGDVLNIAIALLITKKVEGHAFNIN
jgi:hypothetical protein